MMDVRTKQFLRRKEVIRVTGVPASTLYELIGRGDFPRPVRLTPRLVGWDAEEILHWQKARIAARDAA
jgi:prophage regulatory protein